MKGISAALTAIAIGLTGTTAMASTTKVMRCSDQLPPSAPVAKVIDRWANEVNKLADGDVKVQIYGANSLVSAKENITAVAKGDIECAFSVNFQWGRTLPIMTVTTAPFAFSDMNIWRHWAGSDAAKFLAAKLRQKGVQNVVWLFQTNTSVFTSNGHPLIKPSDFKGMKIRGLVPAFNDALKALGASPVSMSGSDVYQALSTGVIDGGLTGIGAAHAHKYYEVQKYFVVTPVISVFFHGYVNPRFYDGLSSKAKQALTNAGKEAAGWAVDMAEKVDAGGAEQLREDGGIVHVDTPAESAALEKIMRPAFDKAFDKADPDSKKLMQLIDKLHGEH